MKLIRSGPVPAKLLFIGEKVGWWELQYNRPMTGEAGREFDSALASAGLTRANVHVTNIAHEPFSDVKGRTEGGFWKIAKAKAAGRERINGKFPVDEVLAGMKHIDEIIDEVDPDIIIPCGKVPLWVLHGLDSITKWRGSILEYKGRKSIPTYNPAAILRQYALKSIVVQDFRRVAHELPSGRKIHKPTRDYILRPSLDTSLDFLTTVTGKTLALDIETCAGQISCVGLAPDKTSGLCIPFISTDQPEGYWSGADELTITLALRKVLTHPDTKCILHNGQYDIQYFAHQWGYTPNIEHDTMIAQHVVFPGVRKSLDFIASMYCDHYVYWKDDGKEWNPKIHSQEQHWAYNLDDCVYTFECNDVLQQTIDAYNLREQYEFQMSLFYPVLRMMLRGLLVDKKQRNILHGQLLQELAKVSEWFEITLGHPLNPDDNSRVGQMRRLFYNDLGTKPIRNRKTGQPTLDKDALHELKEKEPLLRPLINKVEEYRSYRVFHSNFVKKALDPDGRMRSTISIPGTESFRFSSSENPWGRGCNLQTIPVGSEE